MGRESLGFSKMPIYDTETKKTIQPWLLEQPYLITTNLLLWHT